MNDEEQMQRSRIAKIVFDLWGQERTEADAGVIGSASQALARIEGLTPEATEQLDMSDEANDE